MSATTTDVRPAEPDIDDMVARKEDHITREVLPAEGNLQRLRVSS
jgi:hypothetical protein